MYCIESPDSHLKRYMPADLSECDKRQYIDMCALLFRYMSGQITYTDLKTHAVYRLLNMVPSKAKPNPDKKVQQKEDQNKYGNVYRITEKLESFFEMNEAGQRVIKQYYIHNPVPSFRPAWRTYHGPSDQFMNIKWGEYSDALRLFMQFNSCGDVGLLYDMAAILYRKKKTFHFIRKHLNNYDGDLRQKYNPNHIEKRAKAFEFAPIGFIYGVYLYFASFQKFISTATIPWAGKELDFSILFQASDGDVSSNESVPDIGMDSIMFMMAESGTFGTKTELENTGIWMVWVRMYEIRRKDLELKKIQEDAERKQT